MGFILSFLIIWGPSHFPVASAGGLNYPSLDACRADVKRFERMCYQERAKCHFECVPALTRELPGEHP